MYNIYDYGRMLAEPVRLEAYKGALRAAVKPGAVVLDIGTGTGFFALYAASLGARKVYGVEPVAEALAIAKRTASMNGYADRIEFFEGLSTALDLPEKADVIVSDLRGRLPLYGRHLAALVDAKSRHLADGGALLPLRDHLFCAPIEAPQLHHRIVGGFEDQGFDLSACRDAVINLLHTDDGATVLSEQLVAEPVRFATLEYGVFDGPVRGQAAFAVTRASTVHGLALWFDAEIDAHHGFSLRPGHEGAVYGRLFLAWPEPVRMSQDTRIAVEITALPTRNDYVWAFVSHVEHAGFPSKVIRQSTFLAAGRPTR